MTWQRLESSSIDGALEESIEARVADPLWLIGKQWQVGELTGDDAASPVLVECDVVYSPITRLQPGPAGEHGHVISRDRLGIPLETAVERENVRGGPAMLRLALEAGLQLMRMLEAAGVAVRADLRRAWPPTLPEDDGIDPYGRAQLELLARRSFDAAALCARLDSGGASGIRALDQDAGKEALGAWRSWYAGVFSEPAEGAESWNPQRMEYSFRVAACPAPHGEVVLDAGEYSNGHLDWHAFDVRDDLARLGAPQILEHRHVRVAPTPARYAGQAASRWWQVEDADVSFGDLHTGSIDLARAAIGAYGASFGVDWFLVPVRLPTGVLARVEQLTVHDTFGETHLIRSCAELDGPGRTWRFFELTGDVSADAEVQADRTAPWLALPPALPGVTESPPIEEVIILRDELANVAWAAELRIESAAGRPIDRVALARAARARSPVAAGDAWLYILSTSVLDNYVPLVPARLPADGGLYLQRGRVATGVERSGVLTHGALGRILEPGSALLVHDDEVPVTGIRVTRSWQMGRSADGGAVCWVGRRKSSAPPRRAPGLVFDEVATGIS